VALGAKRAPSVGIVPLPYGCVTLYGSSVGGAGAGVTVTLTPAFAYNTVFLTQAFLTATSPVAQQSGVATISDGTWTLNFEFVETTSAGGALPLTFLPPLMASAPNTPITVTVPAIAGGSAVAVSATGYEI
jgi:hypothetical protein